LSEDLVMADMNEELTVQLRLIDNMSASLATITNKLENVKGKLTDTGKSGETSFDKLKGVITGVAGAAGLATGAFALVVQGVKAVANWIREAVEAAGEAEIAFVRLNAVIENTGRITGVTTQSAVDWANAMMTLTGVTHEEINAAQAIMATFQNISAETFPRAMQAATDLSAVLGTDLASAARMVGMAMENPVEGIARLRRAGVMFTEGEKAQIAQMGESAAQMLILGKIESSYGGVAVAMADTYVGSQKRVKAAQEEVREAEGSSLAERKKNWNNFRADIMFAQARLYERGTGEMSKAAVYEEMALMREEAALKAQTDAAEASSAANLEGARTTRMWTAELEHIAAMGDIQVTTTNRIRTIREGWKGLGDQVKDVADRVLREGGGMWNQALTEIDEHTGTTAKAQADLTKDIEDAFKKLKGGGSIESFGAQIDEIGRDLGFGDSLATMEKNFQDAATQANYYLATIPDVTNKYVYINTIYTGGGGPPKGPPSVPMTMMTAAQWAAYLAAHPPGGPAGGGIFDLGSGDWLKHGLAGGGTLDAFDAMLSEWRPVGELGEEGMLVKNGRVTIVPHNRWENMKRRGLRPGGGFRLGGVPEDIYIPPPPTVDLTDIDLANLYPPPGGVPDWAKDKSQYSSDYTHPAPPAPRPAAPAEQIQINLAVQQKAEAAKQAADQLAELKSINSGIRDLKRIIPVATRDAVLAANPGGIRSG
jgi:hypothetical protein